MSTVKTYKNVNAQKQGDHFRIFKMEDIYMERNGVADEPHRHNYYTVLVVNKAKGNHKIDFNDYPFGEKQIYFVAPGQVHQIIEEEKPQGHAMIFSTDFLVENSIPLSFIASLNLFQNYGQSPPLLPNAEQFSTIENFANQMLILFNSQANMSQLSIGAFLKLLLIECNNICAINPIESDVDYTGDALVRRFKTEVDKQYRKEHSSTFYAQILHISPDHLNRTIKLKIGKTAKEYIQSRLITEAKRLLYFTDLSNKEIGYELGFNEPAHFSAFFKKQTQKSPSHFKKTEIKS